MGEDQVEFEVLEATHPHRQNWEVLYLFSVEEALVAELCGHSIP